MRLAFVIRLGSDTRPTEGLLEGWVEEVDSGVEVRFRSTVDLVRFLGERFAISQQRRRADGSQSKAEFPEKDS
jgi:hypothetical protein